MQRTYAVTATPHTSSTTGQAESDARASRSPSQQALSQNQASGAIEVSSTRVQKESGSSGPEIPSKPAVRVLHVVDNLEVGGTETQMVQVALRLDPHSYYVAVAALRADGPLNGPLRNAGIRIIEFPKRHAMLSFQGIYQLIRMALFIRREKFDVVHAHDLWANLMAVPAARLAGVPVVLSSQRNLAHAPWYTPFRKNLIRRIHLLATLVIANSGAVKQILTRDFRIPSDHVHILHNGLDLARFGQPNSNRDRLHPKVDSNTKLVINVANMNSEVKGHATLIEAARKVCSADPQAMFALVGDGEERARLEEQVRRTGLEARFLFLGRRGDVPEILSCCDLFVLPSQAEGMPNALLEAMAERLPVVATSVGGVPEVVQDGVDGLLIPPHSPDILAEAILRLLRDPELAHRLALNGQNRVSLLCTLDRQIKKLEQIYNRSS